MNNSLLDKLSCLADELDSNGHVKIADDIDRFISDMARVMEELKRREDKENEQLDAEELIVCPKCEGLGRTKDEPFCSACKGEGFFSVGSSDNELIKNSFIRKRKDKWCVISRKGKSLGCYKSKKAAQKRLRQIEFFKHNK